jgi:hypothetical protein
VGAGRGLCRGTNSASADFVHAAIVTGENEVCFAAYTIGRAMSLRFFSIGKAADPTASR